MKSVLLFISLFLLWSLQAQEQDLEFKCVKTDEKKVFFGIKAIMNLSAFVLNNKTSAENYQKVYDFIAKEYEYPEFMILSTTESEETVIQELAQGFCQRKSLGFISSFDIY